MGQFTRDAPLQDMAMSIEKILKGIDKTWLKALKEREAVIVPEVERVIQKYTMYLSAQALAIVKDRDVAQEVLQLTWITLYLDGTRYGVGWLRSGKIYGWLKTVVHNTAYDYQQHQSRLVSLDTAEGVWLLEEKRKSFEDPEEMVLRHESSTEVLEVVRRSLSTIHAKVFLMYYYQGYSIKEVAMYLNLPEGTVKSHLSRGREHLRRSLTQRIRG